MYLQIATSAATLCAHMRVVAASYTCTRTNTLTLSSRPLPALHGRQHGGLQTICVQMHWISKPSPLVAIQPLQLTPGLPVLIHMQE